ncbi:fam-l protein [Plasmodium malariae]|uniref:Fam-l protein n=1 Tax=Plasmodium malariae TaxID=5858 RepID=A0A1D3JI98_PLAMA|nr:fam-l protein [Plasmodium malariae]SBT86058.1 fam-l protein [Plasmodium malariae]
MKKSIMIFSFIKIVLLIFLTWIPHLSDHVITFNKYLGKKYMLAIKLDDRIYRLLAKYKKDKDSKVLLRDDISNNGMDQKKDISNTEKECTEKKKELYRGSLNNYGRHKQDMNNKYSKFVTKKYSYLEKKIFKELDFVDFLKSNKNISDKTYKKIMRKKFSLRLGSPLLLFLLLSTILIVDISLRLSSEGNGFWNLSGLGTILKEYEDKLKPYLEWLSKPLLTSADSASISVLGPLFSVILFVIPFLILGVTLISYILYYHRKAKKYDKIKFSKK